MKFKRIHALYLGSSTVEILRGWGYDLEMHEQGDSITFRHPGLDKPEQCVSTATFRKQWKVVREIHLSAGGKGEVTDI